MAHRRSLTWGAVCGAGVAFLMGWFQYKKDGSWDAFGLFKDSWQWITCAAKKASYGVSFLSLREVPPQPPRSSSLFPLNNLSNFFPQDVEAPTAILLLPIFHLLP